jgi:hypothetical protein
MPPMRKCKKPEKPEKAKKPKVEDMPDLLAQWPSPGKVIFKLLQMKGRLSPRVAYPTRKTQPAFGAGWVLNLEPVNFGRF